MNATSQFGLRVLVNFRMNIYATDQEQTVPELYEFMYPSQTGGKLKMTTSE